MVPGRVGRGVTTAFTVTWRTFWHTPLEELSGIVGLGKRACSAHYLPWTGWMRMSLASWRGRVRA
jgi:hypothetical protein